MEDATSQEAVDNNHSEWVAYACGILAAEAQEKVNRFVYRVPFCIYGEWTPTLLDYDALFYQKVMAPIRLDYNWETTRDKSKQRRARKAR